MKNKGKLAAAGICGLLTVVLILLVRFADVQAIGPEGTCIGLSHLNRFFSERTGVNMLWYDITDWLGIAAILTAGLFALVGFVQLIRRRSLLKIDREILALGGLYIIVMGLYALFEVVIVNYRPVIMPGDLHPEASFPSSHTMLVCVVIGSAAMLVGKYVKGKTLCRALRICCSVVIGVTVFGRLISGVHWFTDILAGVLISSMLLFLYEAVLERIREREKKDAPRPRTKKYVLKRVP